MPDSTDTPNVPPVETQDEHYYRISSEAARRERRHEMAAARDAILARRVVRVPHLGRTDDRRWDVV